MNCHTLLSSASGWLLWKALYKNELNYSQARLRGVVWSSPYLLEETGGILADLHYAHDDVVEVQVAKSGMISALPPHLVQQQIPAVHWWQKVLVLPGEIWQNKQKKTQQSSVEVSKGCFFRTDPSSQPSDIYVNPAHIVLAVPLHRTAGSVNMLLHI